MQTLIDTDYPILIQLIQSQNGILKIFLDYLLEERTLLKQRERKQYSAFLEKKEKCCREVFIKENQLKALLKQKKIELDKIFFSKILSSCPKAFEPMMKAILKELERLLKTCQKENQINGKIISHSRQSLSSILSLMNGYSPHQTLYTAQGNTDRPKEHRFIAEA